ncbi:MAG: hypothetical protein AAB446_02185 [Patescibacteria group bacterium]
MKTSLNVVLLVLLMCSLTFAQESPGSESAESTPTVVKKGDFAVSIKVDKNIASNQELADLAGKIVTRFQEKVKDNATVLGCNLFVSVNSINNETTGKPRKALDVSVYTPNNRSMPIYRVGKLPKFFTEKDQADAIDQVLIKVLELECPPPK